MRFSFQILIKIVFKNSCFQFVLVSECLFYSNSDLKSIEKLIFAAFGKILVLGNAFFYSISN